MFNPNELILEKVRSVEEFDIATNELKGRYTQIESPSLKTSADGREVTDAMGSPIATFYDAQKGTFDFSNSLLSLDLAASQFGTEKEIADETNKIIIPVSEILTISADHTVTLSYVPVGTAGAEVKYVKVINANNTFGKTYTVSAVAGEGATDSFTIDAENKKITLPNDVIGDVIVDYERESTKAVAVEKTTDGVTKVRKLHIHAIFHDPCNTNLVYAGVIICPRAQIDPSSVELNLASDGKHAASYMLNKEYCDKNGKLFRIVVAED